MTDEYPNRTNPVGDPSWREEDEMPRVCPHKSPTRVRRARLITPSMPPRIPSECTVSLVDDEDDEE